MCDLTGGCSLRSSYPKDWSQSTLLLGAGSSPVAPGSREGRRVTGLVPTIVFGGEIAQSGCGGLGCFSFPLIVRSGG